MCHSFAIFNLTWDALLSLGELMTCHWLSCGRVIHEPEQPGKLYKEDPETVTWMGVVLECVKAIIIKRLGYWNKNRQMDRIEIVTSKYVSFQISGKWIEPSKMVFPKHLRIKTENYYFWCLYSYLDGLIV